jgi:hypothetical protein
MSVYTLKSRDGQVRTVSTQKELNIEELEELSYRLFEDISMTPGDAFRGMLASGQRMFYSMGEAAVDFTALGRGAGEQSSVYTTPQARKVISELEPEHREAVKLAELERQADLKEISNSIREIRIKNVGETNSKIPLRVQESFPYKAVNVISQLAIQVAGTTAASAVAGPAGFYSSLAGLTIPVGYTVGKDDYYNAIGKTPSTATAEEQLTAENVGAINAIQSYALNTFGAKGLQKVFLKNKSINKKFFQLAEEGKLTQDSLTSITKDVLKAAGLEGATEAGDQIGLNILANTLFDYDPERETLEGSGEAFVLGSIGAGTFAGLSSAPRAAIQVSALPLKAINNVAKAVSGISKSLAKGTLNGRDMVKNSPLTAKILDGLMKKGIDVSKIGETISKKVVPITKESIESLKNNKVFQKAKSVFDKVASPITSVIYSINKNVGITLKSYSWADAKRKDDFLKMVSPFIESPKLKAIKENNPEDYQLIFEGWHKSNNAEALAPLIEKYDLSQEFQSYREALKSIREQAMAEGIDVGEVEGYLPRFVTDYEGLIKSLGIKTDDNLMELFLKSWKKTDQEPSADEYANFLESYILQQLKASGKDQYKGIGTNPLKNRIIDNVSSDNVKFYADPIKATMLYINRLSTSITDQQFLRGSNELDFNNLRNIKESDVHDKELAEKENSSSIKVNSVYDENPDLRLSPTVDPEGDVNTKRQGKVSQNGLPLIIGTPIGIKGVPVMFESNVDKALYIFHEFKKAKADPSLREYLKRQLNIKQTKSTGINITAKGKDVVRAVSKSNREFNKKAKVDPTILPKSLARGKLIQALVKEIQEGRLDAEGAKKITELLRGGFVKTGKYSQDPGAAFGQKDWADFSRGIKSLTTLAFLGSPLSTITQLGDFTYNLFENKAGAFQADKDVQFDLSDVHMAGNAVGFEFNSDGTIPGPLQKAIDFMFNITGFRKLDESLKVKYLNSTYNRIKTQLGSGVSKSSSKVFEEISDLMGPQRAQKVVDDIRSGKKSDAVSEFLFHKLSGIAPITKFDMTYVYLKYPNIRFLYALKSYTIKQLDYARRNVFKKIFSGNEEEMQEGLQNLFQMLIALMLANAPVEFIHAFVRKGNLPELSDLTTENLWRLLGLNSYTGMIARRDGVGTAAMGMVTPPLISAIDSVYKDTTKFAVPILSSDSDSVKYIPVVGRHIYDWQDKD